MLILLKPTWMVFKQVKIKICFNITLSMFLMSVCVVAQMCGGLLFACLTGSVFPGGTSHKSSMEQHGSLPLTEITSLFSPLKRHWTCACAPIFARQTVSPYFHSISSYQTQQKKTQTGPQRFGSGPGWKKSFYVTACSDAMTPVLCLWNGPLESVWDRELIYWTLDWGGLFRTTLTTKRWIKALFPSPAEKGKTTTLSDVSVLFKFLFLRATRVPKWRCQSP